uniref:SCP domain-containing protein n=1 Tax=Mesocestoides corti TaxID=53468 RepID=A0A5K3EM94_MESCO
MHKLISLLALTLHVLADVPSEEERRTLEECHWKLRESVDPPASNMHLIKYSMKMEKLAEELFTYCLSVYTASGRNRYQHIGGVVMVARDGKPRFTDLCNVNSTDFKSSKDRCDDDCHNYRQMVYGPSTDFGCFIGVCQYPEPVQVLLCAYKPGKREFFSRPYELGPSCSKCPAGYGCYRKQCYIDSLTDEQTTEAK